MAIGTAEQQFVFSVKGVLSAPSAPGVYVLYGPQEWIYVGESNDIQRRLSEHLAARSTCINRRGASAFQYELVKGDRARVALQNHWIATLRPTCD